MSRETTDRHFKCLISIKLVWSLCCLSRLTRCLGGGRIVEWDLDMSRRLPTLKSVTVFLNAFPFLLIRRTLLKHIGSALSAKDVFVKRHIYLVIECNEFDNLTSSPCNVPKTRVHSL